MNRALLCLILLAPLPAWGQEGLPIDLRVRDRPTNDVRIKPANEVRVPTIRPSYPGQLARFGGGIVLGEAGHAALHGNRDGVRDAFASITSPELLVGVTLFDGSLRASTALTNRIPGLQGKVGSALKHNLALAGALTVASSVDVDLNGFTLRDALRGEFRELGGASVDLRPVDLQQTGITVGSFAAAQPVWYGVKRAGLYLGKRVAARFLKTAAIKGALAVAPVPGSRVVAAGATALDVVLAAGDLAGIIITGRLMEEPIQQWNEERRASNAVDAQADDLTRVVHLPPNAESVRRAVAQTRAAFNQQRTLAYLPAIREDLALVQRLRRWGEPSKNLNALAGRALTEYGEQLVLPAQTAGLLEVYEARARQPGANPDLRDTLTRHRQRQQRNAAAAAPVRDVIWAAERALYERSLRDTQDPDSRAILQAAIDVLDAEREIERELLNRVVNPGLRVDLGGTGLIQRLPRR